MRTLLGTISLRQKRFIPLQSVLVIAVSVLLIVLANETAFGQGNEKLIQEREMNLVWSANHGQGEQIFFSTYKKNDWSIPVQISDSEELVFQPVSSVGDDGKIWVVWTAMEKNRGLLQFSVYDASHWTKPRQIDTGMDDNRATTLIVDANNVPWIAWTAVDKSYSDVFWSRWNGKSWDSPVKAHSDNTVPDTHPALSRDETGQVVLSWKTYANGKYRSVFQVWDGYQWQGLAAASAEKIRNEKNSKVKELPEIPSFIKERHKATLFLKGKAGAESIPLSHF